MGGYRYFFNGQEADNEVLGEGALHAFEYRMHYTRIGRFWSVDPLAGKFPWNSTYAFAENMPTWARELEGLEADVNSNDNRVAIDPGHGIKGTKNSKVDPGAVGNEATARRSSGFNRARHDCLSRHTHQVVEDIHDKVPKIKGRTFYHYRLLDIGAGNGILR